MRRASQVLTAITGALLASTSAMACGGGSGHAGDHADSKAAGAKLEDAKSEMQTEETPGHSHDRAMRHGGQVSMTKNHHFETIFAPDGVRIYRYTAEQAPAMVDEATGTVTLKWKNGTTQSVPLVAQAPTEGETTVYFCPMHPEVVQMEPGVCKLCGGMKLYAQDFLQAKADLSKVEPGSLKAVVALAGLPKPEAEVTFTETFEGSARVAESHDTPSHSHE